MSEEPDATKAERVAEFLRRLDAAPPATDRDSAIRLVADTLNAVEDDMTSIPYDPAFPLNDGRMYPPRDDNKRAVRGRPDLTRYRSKGHSTIVGDNGAIRILDHGTNATIFEKPGADGKTL